MSKAVVKKEEGALTTEAIFEEGTDSGFENVDQECLALPFLKIVQSLSPIMKPDHGDYNEKARVGDIYNTVTQELVQEVYLIPCYFKREFTKWVPRKEGGGFRGSVAPDSNDVKRTKQSVDKPGVLIDENGLEYRDTRYHFCLVIDGEDFQPVLITLTSTQIKKSKKWLSNMQNLKLVGVKGKFTPPMYSHVYKAFAVTETKGEDVWKGWHFSLVEQVKSMELFRAAKAFRDQIMEGAVEYQEGDSIEDTL